MSYNLPQPIENSLKELAKQCGIEKIILFGSRARGTNRERSDIDLAIQGGNIPDFATSLDDDIPTLLMFDVVDLDKPVPDELLAEIKKDGIVIYEKI